MPYAKRTDAALVIATALMLSSSPLALAAPTGGGPDSGFFSESMIEQQDANARAAQPGGEWNNSQVNVPSYIGTATGTALGTPDPALGAVTAGVGVVGNSNAPVFNAAQTTAQSAFTATSVAVGVAGGGAGGGGFSAGGAGVTASNAAVGAVLGVLKAVP
jgi:hypothetical protein